MVSNLCFSAAACLADVDLLLGAPVLLLHAPRSLPPTRQSLHWPLASNCSGDSLCGSNSLGIDSLCVLTLSWHRCSLCTLCIVHRLSLHGDSLLALTLIAVSTLFAATLSRHQLKLPLAFFGSSCAGPWHYPSVWESRLGFNLNNQPALLKVIII